MRTGALLVMAGVLVCGCGGDRGFSSDDSDGDSDTDGDTDSDTDGDTDGDTDTGTGTQSWVDPCLPLRTCGNECVDVSSSDEHCGGCFDRCGENTHCVDGECACGEGACGRGMDCVDGVCQCQAGMIRCDGGAYCADVASDERDCGACNRICIGECAEGLCECGEGLVECDSWGSDVSTCADLTSDPQHCGACNWACGDNQRCVGLACVCEPGMTECPGGGFRGPDCVDTDRDTRNCGECGHACNPGEVCSDGVCGGACAEDEDLCSYPGWGGMEVRYCTDLDTSEDSCGACNVRCSPSSMCANGTCARVWPASGCDSCPCDTCLGESCCFYPGDPGFPICVAGEECPTA